MWAVGRNLSIVTCSTRLCKSFLILLKPTHNIYGCVEHLLLRLMICNTYCFDQYRAKDDRFSAQNLKYFGNQFLLCCKDSFGA